MRGQRRTLACWARVRKSELGRQIAVDLQSDANLDENRGRPSHGVSFQQHSDRRFPARLPQGKRHKSLAVILGLSGIAARVPVRQRHAAVAGQCSQ